MRVSTLNQFSEKLKSAINVGTWHHGCAHGPCGMAACGMGLASLCCLRLWLLAAWAMLAFVACGYGCWPALGHGHMAVAARPCGMPCNTMLPCGTMCYLITFSLFRFSLLHLSSFFSNIIYSFFFLYIITFHLLALVSCHVAPCATSSLSFSLFSLSS
ncbi:hypothetical protein NE237_007394 [Protea cynaroides]|uniref:Uncharacterized protein n=1 Tax=Protea cynaroides TaxID=273540 RepID=A0A9Q0QWE9_9MAGN|nr:hypothetical protein NE237_007394 [Protea cynaroides]